MVSLRRGTEDTVTAALKVRASAETLKTHSAAMQRTVDRFVLQLRQI